MRVPIATRDPVLAAYGAWEITNRPSRGMDAPRPTRMGCHCAVRMLSTLPQPNLRIPRYVHQLFTS
jgi:hypothetical protein